MSKALLLINLGTPAAPTAKGLREFYRYFFADRFVFDINPIGLWLLRNLIIMPLRAPRTARDYAGIWMEEGSPLQVYSERVRQGVQEKFDAAGSDVAVRIAMAYSNPLIADALAELEREGRDEILVFPMYPQYARATTESAFHAVRSATANWRPPPRLRFIDDFFAEPAFIRVWAEVIRANLTEANIDHLVFSYHGLPELALRRTRVDAGADIGASAPPSRETNSHCRFGACCGAMTEANRYCYRAQCLATSRAIAAALGRESNTCSVAFQSRFGPAAWIKPYLDAHLLELLAQGKKRIAVATPSFVTDCLETLHEIGREYREQFIEAGGEELILVPNLNDSPDWIEAVCEIATHQLPPESTG